ncbi:surface carbohydrate biosynthesis protein [Bradyrhizobium sp. LM6.10]
MADQPHVCLIVDSPLRDLEGLVLLARQLATRGARATLVPMYEQGFDVPALRPDLVLANYTRPNNADLIKSYKSAGILVGILDTEGIGGKNADQFAKMVKSAGRPDLVDLYCVWGASQYAAFLRQGTIAPDLLHATGCPRYDFCAPPWRAALPKPSVDSGYVLINTNFPTVNPRFSVNSSHEEESMVKAGFSREFARQFIADGGHAYRSTLDMAIKLAKHFADVQFVLRPHPFEKISSYDSFAALPNAKVIQSGTSLEWISGARLLVHQNCSTAIEATMLNVEPLSMEWFNTPALRLDAATRVSRGAAGEAEMLELVGQGLEDSMPPLPSEIGLSRREIVSELYTAVDGASSARVSEVVLATIAASRHGGSKAHASPSPSLRGLVAGAVRRTLGHKASSLLRRTYSSVESERRRAGKVFDAGTVNAILQRIDQASVDHRRFVAQPAANIRMRRMMSGASLQLAEAN